MSDERGELSERPRDAPPGEWHGFAGFGRTPRPPMKRKSRAGNFTRATKRAILERAGYRCEWCGAEGVELACDHVVPLMGGGGTTAENGQALCVPCHDEKTEEDYWMFGRPERVSRPPQEPRVCALIRNAGLTAGELRKAAGITSTTAAKMCGTHADGPPFETTMGAAEKVAGALGVSVGELVEVAEEAQTNSRTQIRLRWQPAPIPYPWQHVDYRPPQL